MYISDSIFRHWARQSRGTSTRAVERTRLLTLYFDLVESGKLEMVYTDTHVHNICLYIYAHTCTSTDLYIQVDRQGDMERRTLPNTRTYIRKNSVM